MSKRATARDGEIGRLEVELDAAGQGGEDLGARGPESSAERDSLVQSLMLPLCGEWTVRDRRR